MRSIFTLLLAALTTTAALAAEGDGRLTITVAANRPVQILVDNRTYAPRDNALQLAELAPGRHTVKVYRARNARNSGRRGRNELLYSATIYIKRDHHVDIMVNRFGKALVDERALSNRRRNTDGRWEEDREDRWGNDGGDRDAAYRRAMAERDFSDLLQRIRGQWFSSSKLNAAREAVDQHYFSTDQVRQLLQLISSARDRLDLAKLAYEKTSDPRNYSRLYDLFSADDRDELDRHVRGRRW